MRSYRILVALSKAKNYLSLDYFMDELQVSKRTIQNELSYLRKMGKKHGFEIYNAYGRGYALEVLDRELFHAFLQQLLASAAVINEESLLYNELGLLLKGGKDYTTAEELARQLNLSKTLLFNKMKTVADYLTSYRLILERKSHYGIRICGSGQNIRKLMLDLYMRGDNVFKTTTDKYIGNFNKYERLMEDCIRDNHLRIGYYEFQVLIDWLKIWIMYAQLYRSNQELQLIFPFDCYLNKLPLRFDTVFLQLQRDYHLSITSEEIKEFKHLVEKSAQNKNSPTIKHDRTSLQKDLTDFFQFYDHQNQTDYSSDTDFLEQLTTHLLFLLDRLDRNINYRNPMLLELCIRYPMIFDAVLEFSLFLKARFGDDISNDELGFIAVHFLNHVEKEKANRLNEYEKVAIICTTGGGVSHLIRRQIISIFPHSQVQTFSFWEEDKLIDFSPNLVFSVVPLKKAPDVPIIYIKELLSARDLSNIKQVLYLDDLHESKSVSLDTADEYFKLFKPKLFIVEDAHQYLSLIKKMAAKMIAQGYVGNEFTEQVLLREHYMSTIFKNGIAMPHPIKMDAKESAIAITVVQNQLYEKGQIVKLIFMVALNQEDFYYYSDISNGLFQLMQNKQKINDIVTHPTLQEVINALKETEGQL